MKKRILALVMILVSLFSLASCALFPVYNSLDLESMLQGYGYIVDTVDGNLNEGITGYVHAYKTDSDDYLYYIYCENLSTANKIYKYFKTQNEAEVAALKMKLERASYALNDATDIDGSKKLNYFEIYLDAQYELEKAENFKCGYFANVVWYGTKQAVADIKQ